MVKKIFALVMVISVVGLFLGGCGSKDDSSASTAGGTATTAGASTAGAATAGDTGKTTS